MKRRTLISLPLLAAMPRLALAQEEETTTAPDAAATERTESVGTILDDATRYDALKSVVVARDGEIVEARGYRGNDPDTPTNIKSASKSVMSALVGIAIDKGVLEGADQKIAPILQADMPDDPDPRMADITIGNLLSMQAGLGRTSGPNYGRWVASRNWVRAALAMPFDGDPGGRMLYSTGSTHLLSAILTRAGGRSTRELAREWLEEPLDGFRIGGWERDPQGIYLGGNQRALGGMDRRVVDAADGFRLFRRWLRLRLVPAPHRRRGHALCVGLWRPDALHSARDWPDHRHDLGREQSLRPQWLPRRASRPGRPHRRRNAQRLNIGLRVLGCGNSAAVTQSVSLRCYASPNGGLRSG